MEEYDVDGELKEYVGKVSEILKQFIETYQGKVDIDSFRVFYNFVAGSWSIDIDIYYPSMWGNNFNRSILKHLSLWISHKPQSSNIKTNE